MSETKKYILNPKKKGVIISGFGKPFILDEKTSQSKLKKLFKAFGKNFVSYE